MAESRITHQLDKRRRQVYWFQQKIDNRRLLEPQGFWEAGKKGYLFSESWGTLVIILGEQANSFGDVGSPAKK